MKIFPSLSSRYVDPRPAPQGVAFMDGQYLPMEEARISVLDYGFLHSDATYDVVHVWNGAFFRLQDHLTRFASGMNKLHMQIPYDVAEITEILDNCVALSGLQNAYVEFICTRGTSPSFSRDPRVAQNRFIAFAIPFGSVANEEQMRHGLHVAVSDRVRIPPASVDPTVKNYHWLDMIAGLYEAYERGADTALLQDAAGNLAEGPGFNLFVVKEGRVTTPAQGVLLGITRQTVFDLCAALGMTCTADVVSRADLAAADEVFVTSTAGGVIPVTRVDGAKISKGEPGPVTQKLKEAYWQMHDQSDFRQEVVYPG